MRNSHFSTAFLWMLLVEKRIECLLIAKNKFREACFSLENQEVQVWGHWEGICWSLEFPGESTVVVRETSILS